MILASGFVFATWSASSRPAHPGQHHIGQQQVDTPTPAGEHINRLGPVMRFENRIALRLQELARNAAKPDLIFNQ